MKTLRHRLFLYCGLMFMLGILLLGWSNYVHAESEVTKIKFINYTDDIVYYNLYWLDSGWPSAVYYGPPCVMGGELQSKGVYNHDFLYSGGRFVLIWSVPWSVDRGESLDKRFDFNIDRNNWPSIIMATTEGVLIK